MVISVHIIDPDADEDQSDPVPESHSVPDDSEPESSPLHSEEGANAGSVGGSSDAPQGTIKKFGWFYNCLVLIDNPKACAHELLCKLTKVMGRWMISLGFSSPFL